MANFNVPSYYGLPVPILIAAGQTNLKHVFKFGFYDSIVNTERTVWDGAGDGDPYTPNIASPVNISSDAPEDNNGDLGAWTIMIFGLDENYNETQEMITLNGLTVVTTEQSFIRITRVWVETAGTNGSNIGSIYVYTGTSSDGIPEQTNQIFSIVSPGKNQTLQCNYTIPKGFLGTLNGVGVSSFGNSNAAATIRLVARSEGGVWQTKNQFVITRGAWDLNLTTPEPIQEKSDVRIMAERASGSNNIDVSAYMDLIMIPIS